MTAPLSVPVASAPRGVAAGALAARVGLAVVLVLCTAVSVGWLALGALAAAARYWPAVTRAVDEAAAAGSSWARALADAAPASEPMSQAVLDYGFSTLNLVLAAALLAVGLRRSGLRTWPIRLLSVALLGSAGAFNLQAHAAARAVEAATGLALGGVHQIVLHGIASAAYILAMLVFPTPSWDGLPGGRPLRGGLILVGGATFLLVGLGTALLPHTTSCVLFFGFLVPVVGLVVLPRRVRRGPGPEARGQARLLFSTLVGGFGIAAVLGLVTLLLAVFSQTPGLVLVDPTAHGGAASGEPVALMFWFSRLASAAIAVVVLVATRHDRLWTAERWFSRGLAVLLVAAAAGGAFVVLRVLAERVLGSGGAAAVATVSVAVALSPLYVRAERLVDRLLYGTRPAPYRVLADITALTHSTTASSSATAPDLARVAEAVARGLGAGVCRLTVRRPGLRDRTYEWTDRAGGFGRDDLLEVPIPHGSEVVGTLAVDRQAASGLHAQRDHLVTDIADGLGVVLEASRSGIELERQLRAALAHAEEIAVSRRRTVAEMDSERRRIERDLHDGAQHHLVSLRLTLGLVEHQVATGELEQAREWLGKLGEQLTTAEAVLAATADGVSSLVLAEKGLVEALHVELGSAHPPVAVDSHGVAPGRRFPAEIEAAVWFSCAESVGNARKHAPGAPVSVQLAERAGWLRFTVRDEGPGFVADAGSRPTGSRGMRNMAGRISAVGGTVTVRSRPGEGTTVEGSVPVPPAAEPEPAPVPALARVPVPDLPEPSWEPAEAVAVGDRPGGLAGQVRELVHAARAAYGGSPVGEQVDELARRLDEPVRIAVLATVDDGRRMLVEALVGVPTVPHPGEAGSPVPVRYVHGDERVETGPAAVVVALPAPVLRAMTVIDVPAPGPGEPTAGHLRAVLGAPGAGVGPAVDAFVVLLHYGRPADLTLLEMLHAAGQRGALGVLALADESGDVAERAVQEYGDDPAVRRVCQAVVPVAPATAVAAARLGDDEHRRLHAWVAAREPDPPGAEAEGAGASQRAPASEERTAAGSRPFGAEAEGVGASQRAPASEERTAAGSRPFGAEAEGAGASQRAPASEERTAAGSRPFGAEVGGRNGRAAAAEEAAAALLDRLGPLGARRALRLVRSGEGATRSALAAALVRHSGLADLQELIASRILRRADALRTRSVLAGLDALLRVSPPSGDDARRLRYHLERVRAGAHELREIELLDVLRSGDLRLPDEELRAAERLLGADGGDVRTRLGLAADTTVEELRAAGAAQAGRWRELAAHPVASTRVREAAQVLVRTCEQLVAEVGSEPAEPAVTR